MVIKSELHPNMRRELIKLAWPLMLSNLAYVLLGALDTWFMGRVSTPALGAVGVGSMFFMSLSLILRGTISGGLVLVAKSFGAGDNKGAGHTLGNYLALTILLAPLALLIPVIAKVYFLITKADREIASLAYDYITIRAWEIPFALVSQAVVSFMMGIGDSKHPMYLAWSSVIINLAANYILVFGKLGFPALGLTGAAWGTVIAQALQALCYIVAVRTLYAKQFRLQGLCFPTRKRLREMLKLGLPIGLGDFVESSAFATFMTLISRLGPIELAASQIANQINSLAFMPGFALGTATSSLVGRALGEENKAKGRLYGIVGVKVAITYMAFLGLSYWIFPRYLAKFFLQDQVVINCTVKLMRIISIYQVFDACNIVFRGALNGAGDTKFTGITTILAAYLLFIPLTYLGAFVFKLGLIGAWLGPIVYLISLGMIFSLRFLSGRWEDKTTKTLELSVN